MSRQILTVGQLNEYIKMLLDGSPILSDICVKGEISNFVNHRTGHFYFSLNVWIDFINILNNLAY